MEDKNVVTRGIINGLLFVLLYTLLVTGIPLINTLAFIALPLPLLYITAVYGLKTGTMVASVATVATVGLSLVFSSMIFVPICFAVIGVLVGYYQYMRKSAVERIVVFIIAPFLSLAMIYVIIEGLYDVSILGAVRETLVETQRLAASFAVDVYDDAFIREYMQMLQDMMPFLLLVFGTMYGFILYGLSTLVYKRVGIQYDKLPAFRNWQFPRSIIAFYFLFMLLGFISFEQGSLMASLSLTGFNIFSIFLLIQGLSFIQTYMYDKKASKTVIVIVTFGLVLLMLVMQLTILFIKIIGLMDLMLRLRDRLKE